MSWQLRQHILLQLNGSLKAPITCKDWEGLPKFTATPPDWEAFREALYQDYPNARKLVTSEILNTFIEERSQQPIHSLNEFATYNQDFRRITGRLAREGHANPVYIRLAFFLYY